MTPPATNEERQAAKDEVRNWYSPTVDDEWLGCFCEKELAVVIKANRTEARNAALEAQVKEGRELIESYKEALWAHHDSDSRIDPWLEATK